MNKDKYKYNNKNKDKYKYNNKNKDEYINNYFSYENNYKTTIFKKKDLEKLEIKN
jgi:hypothetical protein